MTFAAPGWLALGAAVAAALVALHALTVGRPRALALPTARFAPARAPRAARRLARPTALALLALRVAAVACAALALAEPSRTPARGAVARVVVAEPTGAEVAGLAAAVAREVRAGDALVVVGAGGVARAPLVLARDAAAATVARRVDSALAARDASVGGAAAGAAGAGGRGGALSAGLIAARRGAPSVASHADSIELVLVSALDATAVDAATGAARDAWPGRARLVRVPPRSTAGDVTSRARGAVTLRGAPADDALAAALALDGRLARGDRASGEARVRLVRATPDAADSAWARAGAGRTLVVWPVDGVPGDARSRGRVDTAFALAVRRAPGAGGTIAVIAPFVRRSPSGGADGGGRAGDARDARDARSTGGEAPRVVARWADGAPAAVERALGAGCVRTVAVAVPQVGDAALGPAFRAVAGALIAPCRVATGGLTAGSTHGASDGPVRDVSAPEDDVAAGRTLGAADSARLAGRGALLAAAPLRRAARGPDGDRTGALLLALAAALLLAEWPLRRVLAAGAAGVGRGVGDAASEAPDGSADGPTGGARAA